MNIKKIIFIALVLFLSASLLTAAYYKKKAPVRSSTELTFEQGGIYVTPQVGFNSWAIPFGANIEYAMTENIGIGATAMVWFWTDEGYSATVIAPAAEVAYHFTQLQLDKIDLSAGAGLGFAIYSSTGGGGTGGIYPFILLNGRYFFSPTMALNLRLNMSFGTWGSAGATVGVTFRI
jgi:hypothetical protein